MSQIARWIGIFVLGVMVGAGGTTLLSKRDGRYILSNIQPTGHSVPELQVTASMWQVVDTRTGTVFVSFGDRIMRIDPITAEESIQDLKNPKQAKVRNTDEREKPDKRTGGGKSARARGGNNGRR
jgi:hypothetical protein